MNVSGFHGVCSLCHPIIVYCNLTSIVLHQYGVYFCDPRYANLNYTNLCRTPSRIVPVYSTCSVLPDKITLACHLWTLKDKLATLPCHPYSPRRAYSTPRYFSKIELSVFIAFCAIIIVLTFLSNSGIILLVVTTPVIRNSPTNIFAANLALSDLFVSVAVMPIWTFLTWWSSYFYVYKSPSSLIDEITAYTIYNAASAMDFTLLSASLASLALISVERALCVTQPFWYKNFLSKQRAAALCTLPWCYATICLLINLESAIMKKNRKLRITFNATVAFLLPGMIALVCYLIIIRVMQKSGKLSTQNSTHLRKINNIKLAFRILALYAVFICCWLPFFVFYFLAAYEPNHVIFRKDQRLIYGVKLLSYINSLLNPFVYVFIRPNFKRRIQAILCGKFATEYSRSASVGLSTLRVSEAASTVSRLQPTGLENESCETSI